MDIKLKNIRYSKVTKAVAVFLIWLSAMSALFSLWFLLSNQEIIKADSYYETSAFVSEYSRLIHNVTELKVKFKDEEGLLVSGATPKAETSNEERIYTIRERLSNAVNFSYYIKNTQNGDTISNINAPNRVTLLKEQPTYIYIGKGEPDNIIYQNERKSRGYLMQYSYDLEKMLKGTPYEIHAAVIEPIKPGDVFYNDSMNFAKLKSIAPYITALAAASIILMLAAFSYLVYAAGRKETEEGIVLNKVDKIYTDTYTVLVLIAAVLSVALVNELSYGHDTIVMIIGVLMIFSLDIFIGLSYVLSMVRQIKNRQILRNTLVFKLYSTIRSFVVLAFNGKLFMPWLLLVLIGYTLVNGILFSAFGNLIYSSNDFAWLLSALLIAAFNVFAFYLAAKSLKNLSEIIEAAKEISNGNLDCSLNTKEMTAAFTGFAQSILGIQKGMKSAVEEAVKGERMKTELITNVSHDLKTPLTSIINYVDLLKKEELSNENAKEYVAVLEEKSARLKQLVEDLIEASKASSGNLAVNAEKVDLLQLIMQAYGEYEEKIEKTGLDVRVNASEKNVFVNADGRHLWRIAENLLSNALKYSMPNSRVYINIDKTDNYGVLTIKNMSAFPLEISPEQLTERFVRGDASRSTEGSGLGLSIAQGLTQLQGGRFKVDIDGDLFKVTVEIHLWKENL
ncbi:MAG: signal transduction histidine kinase [Clostridia bacterium]|nr:signal transduction histidine kinase [Clostridia bacterium]